MKVFLWHKASFILMGLGIFLIFHPIPFLAYFTYPILAWGLLGLLDLASLRRWKTSLMTSDPQRFWGIIVPASTLFWLFFEFLNFLWPQWKYIAVPPSRITATVLSFVSYSTVIPLVIEVFWFISGPDQLQGISPAIARSISARRWLFPAIGFALLLLFIFDRSFVTAQVMWCIPFFVILPFVPTAEVVPLKSKNILPALIGAAFLSGLIWETGNNWAQTKWDYLLLRDAPHLFQMPLAGYLGYIPFAISLLVVYLWIHAKIAYTRLRTVTLYVLALLASRIFIMIYFAKFPLS